MSSSETDRLDSAEILAQVNRLRAQTSSFLRSFWFPLVLFGTLSIVSAPIPLLWGGPALGVFWAIAGPMGALVVGRYFRNRELATGLEGRQAPYIATVAFIVIGSLLAGAIPGALGAERIAAVGPNLVVAAGLLAFAWLDRSRALAAFSVGLGGLAVWLWTSPLEPEVAAGILGITSGVVFVTVGVVYRAVERARA
jgi:hypothetical protein